MTDGPETPRLRAREHELRVMTRLLFTALGGDRHDNVDFKTIYEALNAAYEAGRQSGVLVRAGAKEPEHGQETETAQVSDERRESGPVLSDMRARGLGEDSPSVGVVAGAAPATEAELEGARPDREATCAWDCQLDEGHSGDCSNRQKLPDKTEPEFERLEAQKDAMLAGRRPWESHGAGAAPAQEPEPSWRCFHCGIVLTTEQAARQHFGLTRHDIRACDALTHPAVQQLTFQHWHAIKQWRDTLSDLVDACYTEGTSPTWRLCGVCGMEHHREATLGDQTHVKDCVVDTAERLLRSWSTLAATSAGVALGEAMFKAWLKQRVADDYNPWGVEKHENLLREAFHAGALAAHGAGRPQRTE